MARSGVLYSATGNHKTGEISNFARYIARKTGKATLLLSCDGGGWTPCEPEIQAGMIRPYRVETNTLPLPILRKISQGYWPQDTSETEPSRINLVPIDYSEIGGIAVEGWTSIGSVVMRYLPDKNLNVGGEDRSKLGNFQVPVKVEGQVVNERFSSNSRADFGFSQAFEYGLVMNFNSLPVEYVLYTALESKTEDDDRTTIYGPALPGKKATAQCPSWVGDCIHGQDYGVKRLVKVPDPADPKKTVDSETVDTVVRMYFMKHPDPATGIMFPAKPRVAPIQLPELLKRFPGGYFESLKGKCGLDTYLEEVDRLNAAVGEKDDELKGWREKMDAKLGRAPANKIAAVK